MNFISIARTHKVHESQFSIWSVRTERCVRERIKWRDKNLVGRVIVFCQFFQFNYSTRGEEGGWEALGWRDRHTHTHTNPLERWQTLWVYSPLSCSSDTCALKYKRKYIMKPPLLLPTDRRGGEDETTATRPLLPSAYPPLLIQISIRTIYT
jgi:hypothetical protein